MDESRVLERLPPEIREQVKWLEYEFPVSVEVAKEQRGELMKERSAFIKEHNEGFLRNAYFSVSALSLSRSG